MPTPTIPFPEKNLASRPIRDLGLKIAGTPLAPILEEFRAELERAGIPIFLVSPHGIAGIFHSVETIGMTTPLAPRSSARMICIGSFQPTRTRGTAPPSSSA